MTMSNEFKEWQAEQTLLTREEHIKEDLYFEYTHHYKGQMQQFLKDCLSTLADMITDAELY